MKSRFILIVILLFALASFHDAVAQSGAAKGRARVRGKVTDPQGKGIDGVVIKFYSEDRKSGFEQKTKSDGSWTANGIAGGNWNLDFSKSGFQTKQISIQVSEISYNKPVELSLEKAVAAAAAEKEKAKTPGLDLVQEGNKLRDAKDYAGAIAKFQAALQANPALTSVNGDIALAYVQMGQKDKAVEYYNKLIAAEPNNQEAKLELATLLMEQGNMDEAKKILGNVDLNTVTNPYTLYNLGVGFFNAKDSQEAIKYWEKAIALDPKMADAYLQLGFAYYALNDKTKAKDAFQKVIELSPGSESAKSAQEMLNNL